MMLVVAPRLKGLFRNYRRDDKDLFILIDD
jgi:hypothetical protein